MSKFLIFIALLTASILSWAETGVTPHTTQGFESYIESAEGTQFSCKKQCFIVLGALESADYLSWLGNISGSGSVGYGFVNGQQIIPGEFRSITPNMTINERMSFSDNQYYSQIPKELPIVIVINGEIATQGLSIHLGILSFAEVMTKNWEWFWKTENLAQYSINLLYGYTVWQTSFTWILSLLFFIIAIGIVFVYGFESRRFFFPVFLIGMIFTVFYDLREHTNLYEMRKLYYDGYVNVPVLEQKNWFGIGYYPDVLEKVSQYVNQNPVWQKVYLAAVQNFPLFGYSQYRLHPADTIFVQAAKDIVSAKKWDIFIRYFSPLSVMDGWEIVYSSQDGGVALYIKQ